MKKLIYISAAALTLAIQGVTFATTSNLDDVDFKQLVCSSMKDAHKGGERNRVEALTEVYSMTQTVLSPTQKTTLVQLAKNKRDARLFCKGVKV